MIFSRINLAIGALLSVLLCSRLAHGQATGGRGASLDEIIAQLDANKDGKVSKDEATGTFTQRFPQWDTDNDGLATREEISAYRLRFGIDDKGTRTATTSAAPRRLSDTAILLKEPGEWRLETMTVPPGFAPDVALNGTEEIRFAPGMFDNTSDTYFTCIIALTVDGAVGAEDLKDFLEKYYRGLSSGRAQRSNLKIDPAQMVAEVKLVTNAANRFTASIGFFDSFSDGRKITLHVEASAHANGAKTTLILLVSPSAKDGQVWPMLREVGKKTEGNISTQTSAKWHPGHYAFVQCAALDESHLYPNFRGIQKTYRWSDLEPQMNRYDFSEIRRDLDFLGKHDRQLVIQVQTKTFGRNQNYCPNYITNDRGTYQTRWGSFNPIIWDVEVNARLNALYTALGKAFDSELHLEAVVIPESATTFENSERERLKYTTESYIRAVEDGMSAMKSAFPSTVVIQYVNMPPEVIEKLANYAKQHGIGFGGPDIYPSDPVLNHAERGVYRLYAPLSGHVPLGAAVQTNDYTQRDAFRRIGGETPVKEIYEFGRDRLMLNYIFWGTREGHFEKVQAMIADPTFAKDAAGGLAAQSPQSPQKP